MAIWIIRAGKHGEFEDKFIADNRVYVNWDKPLGNLASMPDRDTLFTAIESAYPDAKEKRIHNWVSQIWPFAHGIKKGDLVVMPLKSQPAIAIGEVTGDYHFEPKGPMPFYHWRAVKWLSEAIPRFHFGQDLLYSFGAFMTICRVTRNDAEKRILTMRNSGWASDPWLEEGAKAPDVGDDESAVAGEPGDLEQAGRDQIARLIEAKFKEHDLTRLVDAVLKAQGYTTYQSPAGPDGGADILAGAGPLGFGSPQLCVEVKSGKTPVDRSTVDKLLGAMSKFGAAQGLFVSWHGFKGNVQRELAQSFFKVRLWTHEELLEAIFANYDQLDEDLKAELPLKRIWTVAVQEE